MTKKSRKGRARHKARRNPQPVTAKLAERRQQSFPTLSKQAPAAKSLVTKAALADRYRYVLWDLKRSLTIGGAFILLLIVLSFFLR